MEVDDLQEPKPPTPQNGTSTTEIPTTSTGNGSTTGNTSPLTQNGNEKPKQDYYYNEKDGGPFRVYVELNNADPKISINKISVGRMLRKVFGASKHVTEIKNAGKRKVLVYLNSFPAANRLVLNTVVTAHGYKAYIAKHLVSVTGVISGIPTDVSTDEILQDLHSLVPITDVYRFQRYVNGAKIPSTRVSVTFRSNKLPELVKLYDCSIKVEPFYRKAFLCLNCLRYNHKAVNCRSFRRCHGCGDRHESDNEYKECTKPRRCIYCKKDHSTTDANCPERQRQNNIKSIMSKKALTFFEAKEYFPITTSNSFNALAEFMEDPKPGNNAPQDFASMAGSRNNKNPNKGAFRNKRTETRTETTQAVCDPDSEEEARKRKKPKPSSEVHGTALNNSSKASELEKWQSKLQEARSQQDTLPQSTVNHAIQQAFQRYYSAIIADTNLKGQARENVIETSKQFLSFDVIHKN